MYEKKKNMINYSESAVTSVICYGRKVKERMSEREEREKKRRVSVKKERNVVFYGPVQCRIALTGKEEHARKGR